MAVKDYYKILEIPQHADEQAIKKNFRRLAIRFHPDKNGGSKHKDAWYREIQEAYEVLSDPQKKIQYHEERWLQKSKGLPFEETIPLTPEFIEKKFMKLRERVANLDHFRMDHAGLQNELLKHANDEVLEALSDYHDPLVNEQIINHLLICMEPLEYGYLNKLKPALNKIAKKQPELMKQITQWYLKRKRNNWWEQKQGWVIGLLTLLLCLAIVLLTNQ